MGPYTYKGQVMEIFQQVRFGRFRLYHVVLPSFRDLIRDAWKNNKLGEKFTIRPIADQVIGEEILENGVIVAVFGIAVSNGFIPSTKHPEAYFKILTQVCSNENS
jgi:hypothetical protein